MKDLLLSNGDLVLQSGDLALAEGDIQLCQKVRQVMGTNQGEWELDEDEGIPFRELLGKKLDEDRAEDAVRSALSQVDETLELNDLTLDVSGENGRKAIISFTFRKEDGTALEVIKDVD